MHTPTMGRPKSIGKTVAENTSIRIDERQLERADNLIEFVSRESSLNANRSDVLRRALALGLEVLERRRREAADRDAGE